MSEIRDKVLQEIRVKKQTSRNWFALQHLLTALLVLLLWLLVVWILKELIQDSVLLWNTYHNFTRFSTILFSQFLYEVFALIVIILLVILVFYQRTDFPLARQNVLNLLGLFLLSSFLTVLLLLILWPTRTPLREGLEYRRLDGLKTGLPVDKSQPLRGRLLKIDQQTDLWVYTVENPFARHILYSEEDLGLEIGRNYEFIIEIQDGKMYVAEYKNLRPQPKSRLSPKFHR